MNPQRYLIAIAAFQIFLFACTDDVITQTSLPSETSLIFSGSGNCVLCHQSNGVANTTSTGLDVSQPTQWRSTMMANAARDPFWQAMVRNEVLELPALADVIQDKCTNCHIPMGHFEAHKNGDDYFTLDEGTGNPLMMDGVSCTLCHQIESSNFGTPEGHSGGYAISDSRVTFGPYENPVRQPMFNITGYEPKYSEHVNNASLCATCHTLFTPYVDNENNVAGEFAEQTPYIEWANSNYPEEGTTCQTCHMPAVDGEAFPISTLGPVGDRDPFYRHHFVGGNTAVLKMMKAHGNELSVTADPKHFDSTIALATRQLTQTTVVLSADGKVVNDTLVVDAGIQNLAGHKLPSGFPSRRAWLHIVVKDNISNVVFESGKPDIDGVLNVPEYEPHHNVISDESQVQIYETVMQDVDAKLTYQLLRAASYKKDNRLPPRGFSAAAMVNDSIAVFGNATSDPDFNRADDFVGTGADVVHYRIALGGSEGPYSVMVELLYQTIKPKFLTGLFSNSAMEITRFKGYYEASEKSPTQLAFTAFQVQPTGIEQLGALDGLSVHQNFPNPVRLSRDSRTTISYNLASAISSVNVEVMNIFGKVVRRFEEGPRTAGNHIFSFSTAQLLPGVYLYRMGNSSSAIVRKMVVVP